MDETFMKEKPVLPLILSMALPMVVSMLVNSLYNIVDSFFVAQISENAMTALSLVYPVQNLINAIAIGFGVGINAVIAYHLGAGEPEKADTAASRGMLFAAIHGVVMMVASIAVIPSFLRLYTDSAEVLEMGLSYAYVAFSFSIVISLSLAFEKIFQAVGRMKVTMAALLLGCVANIILDPLMIFGIGPFPELGIRGAALATGIGQVLPIVLYLIVYRVRPLPVHLRRSALRADPEIDRKLYGVGVPAILNLALPSLLISALNALLAAFAQSYVVILGVYYKLQTFLYLPANGIIQGIRPLVGYNYGAGEYQRVQKIYNLTLLMNAAIMLVGTILCWAIPGALIGLFTTEADTILHGQEALRIISLGFIVSAVSVTSSGALEGLGKGTPSLLISFCRYVAIILPAAFLLSRTALGPAGVWHAFWVAEAATALIAFAVYRRTTRRGMPKTTNAAAEKAKKVR